MAPPQVNQIIKLKIHDMGHQGEGIGSYEGFTVFVQGALPGELVEVRLIQCQKRFGRAELVSILKDSPHRVTPPCPIFGQCGGCQIMHLAYGKQLEAKENRIRAALNRIGKIQDVQVNPCIPSPNQIHYRNKIQLPVREGVRGIQMGLYARSSHDLIEVDHCLIHCPLGEQIYESIRKIVKASEVQPYCPSKGEGELRHILIRSSMHTQEVLVILVTTSKITKNLMNMAEKIISECPHVRGVIQNINDRRDNVILGREYQLLEGRLYIKEKICGLLFKLSPASFFQVNPQQAEALYKKTFEFADIQGDETVLDAYCGVGTLALIFSKHVKRVIGVESCREAIEDAQENCRLNEIENATFICANAEDYVGSLSEVDVVLVNPPRQGCDPAFLKSIERLLPKTILYISCDPATLARDLAILYAFGYKIEIAQPFDMFPQTAHVECLVKLKLR